MCKYFFSIVLAVSIGTSAFCQEEEAQDEVKKKIVIKDTTKNRFLPTGLRIGTDVIALIRSRDNSFKGWEINFDTDLSRYYFTVDYGYSAVNLLIGDGAYNNFGGNYKNDGHYLRIGADVNFLLKDPDKNMFFIGFRYGLSSFSDAVQYQNAVSYTGFQPISANESNKNLSGHWLEITSGLRVKIISGFWMGYTARLKFAPSVSGEGTLKAYDMPGYGVVSEAPYWGFNYDLYWRFGWRETPPLRSKN
jgi:Domain of unknown function (DUF6048)